MIKLYYSPGACSQAPHIVLNELGLEYQPIKVDLKNKLTETGIDYKTINPKGGVPVIEMSDSHLLTENVAILQYLADQKPQAQLGDPKTGEAHYHFLERMNFIATEMHKGIGIFFAGDALNEDTKAFLRKKLEPKLQWINDHLGKNEFVMGSKFTIADAYLFVTAGWTAKVNIDLAPYPHLQKYLEKVKARPSVQKTLAAEGLLKAA